MLADDGCAFSEEAVQAVVSNLENEGLVLINPEPFMQLFGTLVRRNVWVSPVALDAPTAELADAVDLYALVDPEVSEALPAAFPIGTLIVHEAVDREEGHGVQVKISHGDGKTDTGWWFGKIWDTGEPDENACAPCIECHSPVHRQPSEGLWGVPASAL